MICDNNLAMPVFWFFFNLIKEMRPKEMKWKKAIKQQNQDSNIDRCAGIKSPCSWLQNSACSSPTRNVVLRLYLQRFHDLVGIAFIMTPWTRLQERDRSSLWMAHSSHNGPTMPYVVDEEIQTSITEATRLGANQLAGDRAGPSARTICLQDLWTCFTNPCVVSASKPLQPKPTSFSTELRLQ